jgi:hypothetical protein|tara:strand:+ start:801 stop:1064 length:264 start_codon:yes stop_codon:yes gene_type:complete
MPDATEIAFENAKTVLSEHFQHYAIVVQYDDGSVWHEGDNDLVEKALYHEALHLINDERRSGEELDIDWGEEDDDDEQWVFSDEDDE